ncbi:hypothetical protein D9758_015774 [Tetrapyrgos nigripes]|uniref:Histone deacetylase domain-containing protein n=1 Tax=Tetrapyrgos nigripes TaxID=182062 RepID=A0A8H5C5K0_9AGAR|nr:hypothetical protein D9758_015774 [Tetrapyrgos nigripes]
MDSKYDGFYLTQNHVNYPSFKNAQKWLTNMLRAPLDLSAIVERPERLRAVKVGLAAARARLEDVVRTHSRVDGTMEEVNAAENPDDLASALDKLKIATDPNLNTTNIVSIVHSSASLDIVNNAAVKFIHGDIDGDVYLQNLTNSIKESTEKISRGESEIPQGLAQGDLYLCPGSLNAIQGALGTVCEAVDRVFQSPSPPSLSTPNPSNYLIDRAFVAIRPLGHHCGEDTPSAFYFVNNVAVAAAHAHLKHGINRVQLEVEAQAEASGEEGGEPGNEEEKKQKPGLKVYYGSIHDILSYPCEDGKPELIQAASVSIHGAHGQWVENVHLQPYQSEPDGERHFWDELYPKVYMRLLRKAEEFVKDTNKQSDGEGEDVLVFIKLVRFFLHCFES